MKDERFPSLQKFKICFLSTDRHVDTYFEEKYFLVQQLRVLIVDLLKMSVCDVYAVIAKFMFKRSD